MIGPKNNEEIIPAQIKMEAIPGYHSAAFETKLHADLAAIAEPCQPLTWTINEYDGCKDNIPKPKLFALDELIGRFKVPHVTAANDDNAKRNCPAFSPVIFKEDTNRRCNDHVESVTCLVLDIDTGNFQIDELVKCVVDGLGDVQFILHTTYSHTEESRKYRVVIPFAQPCPASLFPNVWAVAASLFPIDQACKDLSRMYFYPSCPKEREHLFDLEAHDGALLEWEPLTEKGDSLLQDKKTVPLILNNAVSERLELEILPKNEHVDLVEVDRALKCLNPDMSYQDWIKILAAVRRDIGHDGFDTVKEWSKEGTKYPGDIEFKKYWNAAAGISQIGTGTLFHLAKQGGYQPLRTLSLNQFDKLTYEIDGITEERMACSIYECCKHLYRVIAGTNIAFVCDPVTNVWVEDKNNAQLTSWIIQYKASGKLMAQQLFSSDSTKAKKINDALRKLENYTATRGALAILKSMPDVLVPREAFDANDYLVGMRGGECYDLKTNTVREIRPEDMIFRTLSCHFDQSAQAPLWEQKVLEWCCGDKELILLLQKWGGYCLSGLTDFHGYLFLHGDGRNGKSIYINVLKTLMGSYAANMANTTISEKKNTSYTGDIHRLQGCRLVCSSEVPDQEYMNEALVKQLTGGDTVTSRENYGSETEYKPKFKLLLMGNYKPKIKGTDRGIWDRTNLVPFEMKMDDIELDPKLFEKLIAELSGILNWFIEGWQQYQTNPIKQSNMPQRVLDANAEYRDEMDVVKCWHDSNTVKAAGKSTLGKVLYAACVHWLDNNGHRCPNIHDFYDRLKAFGYESKKTNKGLVYFDIALAECSSGY